MKTLKIYLSEKKISITEAAVELGVTRPHLTDVANGRKPAGRKLAKAIENWSGGQVAHSPLLYPDQN